MNKETILSLILVLLILGSVVGMALGSRAESPTSNNTDQNIAQIPTEGFSGNAQSIISQVYPEIIIASKTTLFDTNQIQQDFITIKGIKRTTIEFNKLQDENIIVIVRAVIDETEQNNIVSAINKLDYLTSEPIEFYKQATIDLNEKVLFTSETDENKTLEYEFIDQRVSAIVGLSTQKDDEVSGQVQALFRGEKPESLIFYEATNISANPKMVVGDVTLDLFNWEEEYLIKAESIIENQITKEQLLTDLNIEKEITINTENTLVYNDANLMDFNSDSIDNNNISKIEIIDNQVNVTLKEDINFEEYTEALSVLADNNISIENIFTEPKVSYYIILETIPTNYILNKLAELNIIVSETNKKGMFDITTIELEGNNYNYADQNYGVWLSYPDDENKTSFDLTAQAYVSKKDIVFISLSKKTVE